MHQTMDDGGGEKLDSSSGFAGDVVIPVTAGSEVGTRNFASIFWFCMWPWIAQRWSEERDPKRRRISGFWPCSWCFPVNGVRLRYLSSSICRVLALYIVEIEFGGVLEEVGF